MKTRTVIVSLSEFKAKASSMLGELKSGDRDIVLTQNGSASAVIQDYGSYLRVQEALALMKLMVQGEADLRAGRTTPQHRVFADLKKRLAREDA
jgi:prevent-host-death family protein